MPSPFQHPQAGDLVTPPKYAVRASYTANIASLAAATTTCDTAVTLVEGDAVLLTEQTDHSEDGIYVVGAVASGVAPLTRHEKCKSAAGMPPGTQVYISEGTARGNLVYQLTTNAPIVIGTTLLTFAAITQVAAAPTVTDFTNADHDHSNAANGGALAAAYVTLTGSQVLTNKTLTAPVIADFTAAAHDHGDADDGGVIVAGGVAPGTAYQLMRTNLAGTASEWGGPMALTPAADLPAHVGNDIIPTTIVSGAIYDIPALDAGSTITLPAASPDGTYCFIRGDGTKNDQTVQVRDATGPTNLTTALTGSKRMLIVCLKVGGAWYANAHVSP